MRKYIVTYGLIGGAILAVMMALTIPFQHRIGYGRAMIVGYTTMVIAFVMVYFGIRAYRDGAGGGSISFGRAFVVGLSIALVASCCYVAAWEVIYWCFMPDFAEQYAAQAIERARRAGASEAQIAARAKEMAEFSRMYKNPLYNVGMTLLEPLPVGVVYTLVSAGILSRRRRSVPVTA